MISLSIMILCFFFSWYTSNQDVEMKLALDDLENILHFVKENRVTIGICRNFCTYWFAPVRLQNAMVTKSIQMNEMMWQLIPSMLSP